MRKESENNRRDYWDELPDDLRLMCTVQRRSNGEYCTESVLRYLKDRMNDSDTYLFGKTDMDIVAWIDTAMEGLYPLELNEGNWTAYAGDIREILERSEYLLQKNAPSDVKKGSVLTYSGSSYTDFVLFAQKLDVFFCTLYMYTEEWQKMEERLESLLEGTKRNVKELLDSFEAERYAAELRYRGPHYPGEDRYEPIVWLAREFLPGGEAIKRFARTFEKYAEFLDKIRDRVLSERVCSLMQMDVERRLKDLCELILDEIEDEMEYAEGDTLELETEKEIFEDIICDSNERSRYDKVEKANPSTGSEGYLDMKDADLFTYNLRILMACNPTLPVVVRTQPGNQDAKLQCSVAYLHVPGEEKPAEKAILIHTVPNSLNIVIDDDDLPF